MCLRNKRFEFWRTSQRAISDFYEMRFWMELQGSRRWSRARRRRTLSTVNPGALSSMKSSEKTRHSTIAASRKITLGKPRRAEKLFSSERTKIRVQERLPSLCDERQPTRFSAKTLFTVSCSRQAGFQFSVPLRTGKTEWKRETRIFLFHFLLWSQLESLILRC